MYVASIPFFPTDKRTYDIEEIRPTEQIMMELYPEIYSCIGCNACTKACTQNLNVMQYIAYAQRGEFEKCAEESFDCVSRMLFCKMPGWYFSSDGRSSGKTSDRKIYCTGSKTSYRESGRDPQRCL